MKIEIKGLGFVTSSHSMEVFPFFLQDLQTLIQLISFEVTKQEYQGMGEPPNPFISTLLYVREETIYRKSSIRSRPCIILNPKFPRLVLEVFQKL